MFDAVIALVEFEAAAAPRFSDVARGVDDAAAINASGRPIAWGSAGNLLLAANASDCQAFELKDEFEARECTSALAGIRAKATAVLATQELWTSSTTVALGTYDFDRAVFPLTWVPPKPGRTMGRDPDTCATAIAGPHNLLGAYGYCLYVDKPAAVMATGTMTAYFGGLPQPASVTPYLQLRGAAPAITSGSITPDVAKGLRERGDNVTLDLILRWSWSADRCTTAPSGEWIAGYCWGAVIEQWGAGTPLAGSVAPTP